MLEAIKQEDTYQHKGLRKKLINQIREKSIRDEQVLEAMMRVPRHFFLDPAFVSVAYEDRAFPIAAGQTISQPYTVAYQTQLLDIKKMDKVLEIGTGSCYQACVLAEMGAWVHTIERQKSLFDYVEKFWFKNEYPFLKRYYGDGFKGLPTIAPFDKILITAGAPYIPETLVHQLKTGGIMVIPVDEEENQQRMKRIIKTDTGYTEELLDNFSFVPMLKGKQIK